VNRIFLGRALWEQGRDVRLLPAQYVKPYVKTHKSDYIDAEAIAEESARKSGVKRLFALDWWLDPWGEIGGTSAGTRPPIRY
jgi:hypothetical protein